MGCVGSKNNVDEPASPNTEEKLRATVARQRRRLSVEPNNVGDINRAAKAVEAEKVDENELKETKVSAKTGNMAFAACSQKGYVPYNLNKSNQDRDMVRTNLQGKGHIHLFGVMDGHGEFGHYVSEYVKKNLPTHLEEQDNLESDPPAAIETAVKNLCEKLKAEASKINCAFSGTTAVFSVMIGSEMYIANIGDSRCVMARNAGSSLQTIPLSEDQKPENPQEKERILAAGGRVATLPGPPGEDCGPYRVWLGDVDVPGLAMSRSIGDDVSHTVGVISVPEVKHHTVTEDDTFAIWASDGVWEFIESEQAVKLVKDLVANNELEEATKKLVKESTQQWQKHEDVIDDITCVIVKFNA